jgi:hypothetical protein
MENKFKVGDTNIICLSHKWVSVKDLNKITKDQILLICSGFGEHFTLIEE